MSYLLKTLTKKEEVDSIIRSTIDKVLVLRLGRASDSTSLLLDDILATSSRDVSKFATVALVDVDSDDIQVFLHYFDITLIPSTVFFFNAHHMKMDSGTADHTKWIGAFRTKQDFIDVVEAIFRGAMKGKLIVNCPLPPERIPKYQLTLRMSRTANTCQIVVFVLLCLIMWIGMLEEEPPLHRERYALLSFSPRHFNSWLNVLY